MFPSLLENVALKKDTLGAPAAFIPKSHAVHVLKNIQQCNLKLEKFIDGSVEAVGIDCEWDFGGANVQGAVAIVQISGVDETLILQVGVMNAVPAALISLLANERIFKVGRNVGGDVAKLIRDFNLTVEAKSILELGKFSKTKGAIVNGKAGLAEIVLHVLGKTLSKSVDVG